MFICFHNIKRFTLVVLLLICAFSVIRAQQNFINVPSSDVTKKHKIFFQEQLNFNELIQSNSTIDFGLGKGFEIGANVLGLNFNNRTQSFLNNDTSDVDPYNPLVCLNGSKRFELTEHFGISIGAQAGVNFTDNQKPKDATLIYTNLAYSDLFVEESKIVAGAYYNSVHYGGNGNRFGAWCATEFPVLKKLHLMAESIFGDNAISFTSIGLIYYPHHKIPLTLGLQIPNTSKNSYALVFEFTFVP